MAKSAVKTRNPNAVALQCWPGKTGQKGKSVKFMNASNLKLQLGRKWGRGGIGRSCQADAFGLRWLLLAAPESCARIMQSLKPAFRRKTQTAKSFRTVHCKTKPKQEEKQKERGRVKKRSRKMNFQCCQLFAGLLLRALATHTHTHRNREKVTHILHYTKCKQLYLTSPPAFSFSPLHTDPTLFLSVKR